MIKIFLFCKHYLLMYKWQLGLYIILCMLTSVGGLISPYIVGDFIDQLINAQDVRFIFNYFILFGSINLASLLLGYINGRLYVKLQTQIGFRLNRKFIKHLQFSPLSFTSGQDITYLNQRINNDSNQLVIFCISLLQNVLVNFMILVIALVLIFTFHPFLASVLLILAGVYFTIYVLFKKKLYKTNLAYQEAQSKFFSKLYEQLANIRFVKLNSLFKYFVSRLDSSFEGLLKNALVFQKTNYMLSGLDKLVAMIAQMLLFIIGGNAIIFGSLTIGRFIIISIYFNMLLGAVRYFFGLGQTIQTSLVSYNRLNEIESVDFEHNGTLKLDNINTIEIERFGFKYGNNEIIKDLNIQLTKGNIYFVLGLNGAGKSTLLNSIIGLNMKNYSGAIKYNGIDINDIDMYTLRELQVGIVDQGSLFVPDTFRYNVCPNEKEYRDFDNDKLNLLVHMLKFDTYIQTLPAQFETTIGEGSANISGGEKQKLSLLRALYKSSDVLILDEPTSALDQQTGCALMEYLNEIKNNKIIIIVTHDNRLINAQTDISIRL